MFLFGFVFFLKGGREGAPPSVWLSVTTANITEVEICPGLETDVFISSPAREVPGLCFHTFTHTHIWTDRQTAWTLNSSLCSSVCPFLKAWVPLWAGRQRKPSVVTGNETLGFFWKHARLQNYHLAYLQNTLSLRATAQWQKLIMCHPIPSACK